MVFPALAIERHETNRDLARPPTGVGMNVGTNPPPVCRRFYFSKLNGAVVFTEPPVFS